MVKEFLDWFLKFASDCESGVDLIHAYMNYLNEIGFLITRGNFGTRTLHPQVETMAYLWVPKGKEPLLYTQPDPLFFSTTVFPYENGSVKVSKFKVGSLASNQFTTSPIQYVLSTKNTYYFSFLDHNGVDYPYPILKELADSTPTAYFAVPVVQAGNSYAFLSLVTEKPFGFTKEEKDFLSASLSVLSLKMMTFLQYDLTKTLLGIYLGKTTGERVSSGKIHRGNLEEITSVIWFSDIRNYSGISELLSPQEIVDLLNTYFGLVIPVIEEMGGEVLKLLGDGILAVFPYQTKNQKRVGYQALIAVRKVFRNLMLLNRKRATENKIPIEHGVGLHLGTIRYGNIGSEDRLDFTVIGEAVNLASRIAGMCGQLKKAVLSSERFAEQIGVSWEDLGEHKLKGIQKDQRIYAIPEVEVEREWQNTVKGN
ncbi:adenylate/guanylate cyclase catalytic domain protein [Leptospira ryugenii]|uniref:Adenylate/guanylate cyclase catalytic domain protein n=1 Tax=Leptospira ryugenii TaxID=1917863 RepID=A0A2P2E1S6_9LEPT|nr:adenylate/guanylate cyclase domain-containing protein [Leptospira ryugenii]GBF50847.1 adenylate/guanylate cyclase catalytic domain protein [Leptospira ryugenii]